MSIILQIILLFTMPQINGQDALHIRIAPVSPLKGKVYVLLHNSAETFPDKQEGAFRKQVIPADQKEIKLTFENLPEGEYAISVWHDKNDNGKFDKNMLGIPKDGLGFSKVDRIMFSSPDFQDALFTFTGGKQEMRIKTIYFF